MSGELTKSNGYEITNFWEDHLKIASQMISTGLLPKEINTPQKALLVMATGKEIGIGPIEALKSIYIVNNKTALGSQLMLSLVYRSGQLEDIKIDSRADVCHVTLKRKGMTPYTATFGDAEVTAMGLQYRDQYKKQKQNMLRWRCISSACRIVFPDVLGSMYTPEEIQSHSDNEERIADIQHQGNLAESPDAYEKFKDDLFAKMATDLVDAKDPIEAIQWKRGHSKEIAGLKDADREEITSLLDSKHSELVTGNFKPEDKQELNNLDDYCSKANKYDDYESLKAWFLSIRDLPQTAKALKGEDYNKFIDHLTKRKQSFPDKPVKAEEEMNQTSLATEIADHIKESQDKNVFDKRMLETKTSRASLLGNNRKWVEEVIAETKKRWGI